MTTERQLPEVLHYVIWFNPQSTNYEPLAVFNTASEADGYVDSLKSSADSNNRGNIKLTVVAWTWPEFCAFAQNTEIQPAQVVLSIPDVWTPKQITEFQDKIREGVLGMTEKIKVLP